MSLHDVAREHRRLAILIGLGGSPEYTSNVSVLTDLVNAVGVPSSQDQVDGDCVWLEEQGLVHRKDHGGFVVVRARRRGLDVASGRAVVVGVKRPSAKD